MIAACTESTAVKNFSMKKPLVGLMAEEVICTPHFCASSVGGGVSVFLDVNDDVLSRQCHTAVVHARLYGMQPMVVAILSPMNEPPPTNVSPSLVGTMSICGVSRWRGILAKWHSITAARLRKHYAPFSSSIGFLNSVNEPS